MSKRTFKESRFVLSDRPAKIDDPHVARAPRQIESVDPRLENITVWSAVRIDRLFEPRARQLTWHIESATLRVAHEGHGGIFKKCACLSDVSAKSRQIGVDALD